MIFSRYLTCLLLYIICSYTLTAQTQLKYHKTTGFDTNFPFDEPFQVKLEGFENDTPYTQYRMVFRHLNLKKKKALEQSQSDTELYKSLDSFTVDFAANGIGVYPRFMKPNEYYIVDLVKPQRKLLSVGEKTELIARLWEDETLLNAYMDFISSMNIHNFDPGILRLPLAQRLEQEHIYFVTSATTSFQSIDNDLDQTIQALITHIYAFGTTVHELKNNLTRSNRNTNVLSYLKTLEALEPQLAWVNDDATLHTATGNFDIRLFREQLEALGKTSTQGIDNELVNEIDHLFILRDDLLTQYRDLLSLLVQKTEKEIYTNELGRVLSSSKVNEDLVEGNTNRVNASISQTFGWGYSPKTSNGYLYVGYTLFFRPVNYSVPFRNIRGCWEKTKAMVGLNLGFTLSDIETNGYGEASGIVKFLGNKGLIVGLGIRPYHFVKIDLNGLLYNISDPNPLITHKKVAFTPMIGLSLNINLIKLFQGDPNSFTTLFKP